MAKGGLILRISRPNAMLVIGEGQFGPRSILEDVWNKDLRVSSPW